MKKVLSVIVSILLVLSLAGCQGESVPTPAPTPRVFAPARDAQGLIGSAAFSETLTQIDADVACIRYGVEEAWVTEAAVYGSTGATAEELALFTFDSADHAQEAARAVGFWLEDRAEALSDYLPNELPKLEKAVLRTEGTFLLLAVCADCGPIEAFLEG